MKATVTLGIMTVALLLTACAPPHPCDEDPGGTYCSTQVGGVQSAYIKLRWPY